MTGTPRDDTVRRGFDAWLHTLKQIIGVAPLDPPKSDLERRVRVVMVKIGILR